MTGADQSEGQEEKQDKGIQGEDKKTMRDKRRQGMNEILCEGRK